MLKYVIDCNVDGNEMDYSEIIESESEPRFWEQYEIA